MTSVVYNAMESNLQSSHFLQDLCSLQKIYNCRRSPVPCWSLATQGTGTGSKGIFLPLPPITALALCFLLQRDEVTCLPPTPLLPASLLEPHLHGTSPLDKIKKRREWPALSSFASCKLIGRHMNQKPVTYYQRKVLLRPPLSSPTPPTCFNVEQVQKGGEGGEGGLASNCFGKS